MASLDPIAQLLRAANHQHDPVSHPKRHVTAEATSLTPFFGQIFSKYALRQQSGQQDQGQCQRPRDRGQDPDEVQPFALHEIAGAAERPTLGALLELVLRRPRFGEALTVAFG